MVMTIMINWLRSFESSVRIYCSIYVMSEVVRNWWLVWVSRQIQSWAWCCFQWSCRKVRQNLRYFRCYISCVVTLGTIVNPGLNLSILKTSIFAPPKRWILSTECSSTTMLKEFFQVKQCDILTSSQSLLMENLGSSRLRLERARILESRHFLSSNAFPCLTSQLIIFLLAVSYLDYDGNFHFVELLVRMFNGYPEHIVRIFSFFKRTVNRHCTMCWSPPWSWSPVSVLQLSQLFPQLELRAI